MFFFASLALAVLVTGFLSYKSYDAYTDTSAYIERAQVAADIDDMRNYITRATNGMRKHKMNRGHAAIIFKNPSNDLGLINRSLNQARARLTEIKGLESTDVAFQQGLDDVRGILRETNIPVMNAVYARFWYLTLLILFFPVSIIILFREVM